MDVTSRTMRRGGPGRRLAALVLAAGVLGAGAVALPAAVPAAGAAPAAVAGGSLTWGLKQSFRDYVGAEAITVRDGASINDDGTFDFPVRDGEFDATTGTTQVRAAGTVHFQQYCDRPEYGLPPGECVLDLTLSDPRVVIGEDTQVLYGHVASRARDAAAGYPMVEYGEIPMATLDLIDAELATGGTTTWSGLAAAHTTQFSPATTYAAGTPLDPVALSYDGPGGWPVGFDGWTPPGTTTLARVAEWDVDDNINRVEDLFVDERHGVVHVLTNGYVESDPMLRALDRDTLAQVGRSAGPAPASGGGTGAFDPDTSTVFTQFSGSGSVLAAWTWDGDAGDYQLVEVERLAGLRWGSSLAWDATRSSVFALTETADGADVLLTQWRRDAPREWHRIDHELPEVPGYESTDYYRRANGTRSLAALPDGSLLLTRYGLPAEAGGTDRNVPPLRLAVADGGVSVEELDAVTGAPPAVPREADRVTASVDGRFAFEPVGAGLGSPFLRPGRLDGTALTVDDDPLAFAIEEQPLHPAFPPGRDEWWVKALHSGVIYLLRDGEVLAELVDQEAVQSRAVVAGTDGALFTGGRRADRTYGVFKYAVAGVSPAVTEQPTPVTAQTSTVAAFSARAAGQPEPSVRWQRRLPGETGFSDLPGATATTLTVDAVSGWDGAQYRAVFTNPAGAITSDPATLTVTGGGGSGPGEGEQEITVTVPPAAEPGEFVWSISGTDRAVSLGTAQDRGDHWYAAGELHPIVVSDTRTGGPQWSISGQVSDAPGGLPGDHIGWAPEVVDPGAGAVAGDPVAPVLATGDGLAGASLLAGAEAGHEPGTATIGAELELRLPATTPAGTYLATLTITAVS